MCEYTCSADRIPCGRLDIVVYRSKITKQNETVFVKMRLLLFFSNTFVLEKENKSPSLSRQTIDRGSIDEQRRMKRLRIKPAIDYRFTLGIVDEMSRPSIE